MRQIAKYEMKQFTTEKFRGFKAQKSNFREVKVIEEKEEMQVDYIVATLMMSRDGVVEK